MHYARCGGRKEEKFVDSMTCITWMVEGGGGREVGGWRFSGGDFLTRIGILRIYEQLS